MSTTTPRVIIYGAKGALGSASVLALKKLNWWVLAIDTEVSGGNSNADATVLIKKEFTDSISDQEKQVVTETKNILQDNKVDAIICVAGGWQGGNVTTGALASTTDAMLKSSVWPAVISSKLAASHLIDDGLVVLTGAKAALGPTPTMIGYGLAKAATHHLIQSLSSPDSGLPSTSACLGLLPVTLDTPMNRQWLPDADTSKWTKLETITSLFEKWILNKSERPKSGSLLVFDGQKYSTAP